ncbi:MAG TPA: type VII secretion-associated serine protease mycosin [Micromonosporaceae bacterium]|nr:type VII secretion-associated serine protease mycosin [Micromonosporaceae bacterium]
MPRWSVRLALASALFAVPGMSSPVAASAPDRAPATAVATRLAAKCGSRPAPAAPVAEVPWPQQRYAFEHLTPLATGAGMTVAVIDSGVDPDHPQLRGRVAGGRDFLDGGDGTLDCAGHGTAVASVIAATASAGISFRGLAPQARILPVRVSEQQVVGESRSGRTVTATEFARAIRWAVDQGADVLNLSVVLYEDNPAVRSAVAYALERDRVVVAAVGNLHENGDPTPYPAAYEGVLGVGAIGPDGTRSQFSQTGPYVDVLAPGVDVLVAVPGNGHQRQDGTSYATPFVAATAALVREYQPELSAAEVVRRIIATTDPAIGGAGNAYGSGVVNPYRAITDTAAVTDDGEAPVALPVLRADAAELAKQTRRDRTRQMSWWVASVGAVVAGLVMLVAAVLPRGARRRWRPAGPE